MSKRRSAVDQTLDPTNEAARVGQLCEAQQNSIPMSNETSVPNPPAIEEQEMNQATTKETARSLFMAIIITVIISLYCYLQQETPQPTPATNLELENKLQDLYLNWNRKQPLACAELRKAVASIQETKIQASDGKKPLTLHFMGPNTVDRESFLKDLKKSFHAKEIESEFAAREALSAQNCPTLIIRDEPYVFESLLEDHFTCAQSKFLASPVLIFISDLNGQDPQVAAKKDSRHLSQARNEAKKQWIRRPALVGRVRLHIPFLQ